MAFYSWSHQAGFPLCGIPLEACQTFPYTAQSVHTHTHTRCPVEYPALSFSFSVSSPCVFHSHSHCLHGGSRRSTHARSPCQKDVQYIPVGTYHFHATGLITYVYQQEPASVTGSSHNKRVQVSEDLALTLCLCELRRSHEPAEDVSHTKNVPCFKSGANQPLRYSSVCGLEPRIWQYRGCHGDCLQPAISARTRSW